MALLYKGLDRDYIGFYMSKKNSHDLALSGTTFIFNDLYHSL